MALREIEDEVTGARDGDERAGTGAPELRVERIPCQRTQLPISTRARGARPETTSGRERRETQLPAEADRIWPWKGRAYLSWTVPGAAAAAPWLRAASASDRAAAAAGETLEGGRGKGGEGRRKGGEAAAATAEGGEMFLWGGRRMDGVGDLVWSLCRE